MISFHFSSIGAGATDTIELLSSKRALKQMAIYAHNPSADVDSVFWRVTNLGVQIIPNPMGSVNQDTNAISFAPMSTIPDKIDLEELVLSGPPYQIKITVFNGSASAISLGGYFVECDPIFHLDEARLRAIFRELIKQDPIKPDPERDELRASTPKTDG